MHVAAIDTRLGVDHLITEHRERITEAVFVEHPIAVHTAVGIGERYTGQQEETFAQANVGA